MQNNIECVIRAGDSLKKSIIETFENLKELDNDSYQILNIDFFEVSRGDKVEIYKVNKIRVFYGKNGWEISEFLLGDVEPKKVRDAKLLKDVKAFIF